MKKLLLLLFTLPIVEMTQAQTNTFPASGSVGIGTLSPKKTLDVRGGIESNAHVMVSNPNNDEASVQLSWLNDIARIRIGGNNVGASGGFHIQGTGDRSLMRFLNNGNIGIV